MVHQVDMEYNTAMDKQMQKKIEAFFSTGKRHMFKKGEILIRADEQPLEVMFLRSGFVKAYGISTKGEEVIVTIFKSGSFFPMNWAINDTKNNFFFEALTEVEVYGCSRDEAVQFVKQNSDVLFDLLQRVYDGLDGILERMSYLMGEDAQKRLLSELVISTKRFGIKIDDDTYLLHVSEKDLAAQTGLTRETISREIRKLKEKNLVVINKDQTMIVRLAGIEELKAA